MAKLKHLTGREMSCTPRAADEPAARRGEHGAKRSGVASGASDVSSIELLGRLRRPQLNGPSRAPLSRRRRLNASGEPRPTGTEPGIAKKPALWAVSSTGMLGVARGQHLALALTSCPLALRPARSLRPRDTPSQCPPCPRMHQLGSVGCRVVPEMTTPPSTSPPEMRPLNDPQRCNGHYDETSLTSSGL
jgi:hypothetical protein